MDVKQRSGRMMSQENKTIFIASSIAEWGGSEELWSKTVPYLLKKGYRIVVCRPYIVYSHPKTTHLVKQGVEFVYTHTLPRAPSAVRGYYNIVGKLRRLLGLKGTPKPFDEYQFDRPAEILYFNQPLFENYLRSFKPQLVLISQGGNFDGLVYGAACMQSKVPYVIVSHKAVDFYWPPVHFRAQMRAVFENARQCYFVSQHNKRLTEEQFGVRLSNGQVIFNPVKPTQHIPYPSVNDVFQLCCIGRLFVIEKGQDILIRVLSQERWKKRPIKVSIIGTGPDEQTLKDLAELLEASNVSFCGQVTDIYEVWKHAHALVLPSRTEGLPLVIVEAMMAGRPVITTDVGGNKEFLQEGVTGFVGYDSDASLDETLERAWDQRGRWKEMGEQAARSIREIIPESPEQMFADRVEAHTLGE